MRKKNLKGLLAACLSFSMVVTSFSVGGIGTKTAEAAEDDKTVFTEVLTPDQITLREKLPEKASNITEGESREVTIQGTGTKMTVKDNGTVRKELSSKWLVENEMGAGVNLGNTMEAVIPVDQKKDATPTDGETVWKQPVTTQEYFDALHSYGINTVRIPVSWSNADIDDGTYTLREEFLGRVEEIVNYALNEGMYVIVNDHWDNQWWGQFGACKKDADGNKVADEVTRAAAWTRYESYWTQISERFKDYSDHLIFEGANEELGTRLNDAICLNGPAKGYAKPDNSGNDIVTLGGNLKTDELYEMTNKINQKFVDIVRSTGGNNTYRHLLIPGYDTDISKTVDDRYKMPTDIAENGKDKLFISVHYYTPWDFCGDGCTGTYTVGDQKATYEYFNQMKEKFSDNGYGIIIGECGICNPSGVDSSVTQWLNDTFTAAQQISAVPCLWETSQYFDRVECKQIYKDIADFYNTINQADGDATMTKISGGVPSNDDDSDVHFGDYVDKTLWKTKGLHAYITYQTPTWDYRNAYKPLRSLGKDEGSYQYIQAGGNEVTKENTKVTDVQITKDGEYTISLDGVDLSAANNYRMLGIATDIDYKTYKESGIKITNATMKVDGKEVTDAPFDLTVKEDNKYYTFMAVNAYAEEGEFFPLNELNAAEKLPVASKSIEFTFTVTGLDKVLQDIADGTYIDPETGKALNDNTPEISYGKYIDKSLWEKKGAHAYLMYQTASWDYRDAFKPQKKLAKDAHAFEYIKAAGVEAADTTKVQDVYFDKDGDYTVSIDGIDLSGANVFNMLGVATDIAWKTYPGVTITAKSIKLDGKEVLKDSVLPPKTEEGKNDYYTFMAIDKWADEGSHPLDDASSNEELELPSQSVEIEFTVSGLDQLLKDVADGTYIDPQTGKQINGEEAKPSESPAAPTQVPSASPSNVPSAVPSASAPAATTTTPASVTSAPSIVGPKVNATFTSGNYKYKVTKAATTAAKGTVKVVGLTKKGAKAKKLNVPAKIKKQKADYTVTAIGAKAFKGSKATAITLNKNIKTIPSAAFANCKKLKTLTVKAKLKKVAKKSFKGCKKKIKVKGASAKVRKANVKLLKKSGYKKFK
ncbi:cellulase family glycosylhydrolase [Jutongia sp.]